MRIVEPGERGKGIQLRAGDSFVIPSGWLTFSFNPLESTGQFFRSGLDWFAKHVFIDGLINKNVNYEEAAKGLEERMDKVVNESPLVAPLDINVPEESEKIFKLLSDQHQQTPEYWACLSGFFLAWARSARDENDALLASWATACAERCRMMLLFKQHLEDVVFMGQSAKRLIEALKIWSSNKRNSDEEFWQRTLSEHSYVLTQVFAVPVMFIQEKAFVGGMTLDRNNAKLVDYVFSAEASKEAILIEIKTPVARLLGRKYRNEVYGPSAELSASVVQVLAYRKRLMENLRSITDGTKHDLTAFNPQCVLVVGIAESQLDNEAKRESFELFRASCEVEIITYDELFRKVEILAELFNLKRKSAESSRDNGEPADARESPS